MLGFAPTGKSISVIGLVQSGIILTGIMISGMEIRMWRLNFPFERFEMDVPPPGLFVFLAYYGVVLFLIPLVWAGLNIYYYNFSRLRHRFLLPVYYSGYVVTVLLIIFMLYSLITPWSSAPHGHALLEVR